MDDIFSDTSHIRREVRDAMAALKTSRAQLQAEMIALRAEAEGRIQRSRELLRRLSAK